MRGNSSHWRLVSVAAIVTTVCWWVCQATCAARTASETSDTPEFVMQTWRVEEGLPHNSVNAILQTSDGYLWLGTYDGLARFDGVRFTVFGLREGLPSLQVLALLDDRKGALWIGTSLGLCRLRNGRFETWTTKDGLAGNEITTLAEDGSGAIWVGTVTGLSRWRAGRFQTFGRAEGLNDKRIRTMGANQRGSLWVSTFYEGLFEWDGSRFTLLSKPEGSPAGPPVCLMEDRKGNLWTGSANGYVFCREGGEWRRYGREQGLPANTVMRLVEGADGTIWGALGGGGLYWLTNCSSATGWQKADFPNNGVISLLEDRERNLWVGTRTGGLTRLKRKRVSVIHLPRGDGGAAPRALAEAADGVLWAGTSSAGLFRIQDGKADRFLSDPRVRNHPYVSAVIAGRDGSVWWGAGPALFQLKGGQVVSAYIAEYKTWLREDRIRALCEDRDGGIWVGTQNGQLRVLRDGQFLPCTNWQSTAPITGLLLQPDGKLLVGTHGNGVICYQGGRCSALKGRSGAPNPFIRTLCLDSEGVLWMGTEGAGVNRLEGGRLTSLSTQQGLLNDTIVQILEDDSGCLWFGSYRGVFRIRKSELREFAEGRTAFVHPTILSRAEGIPSEQCMRGFNAALRSRAGLLHFSTDRGIVVVNPIHHGTNTLVPEVWLEKVVVDGNATSFRIQGGASALEGPARASLRTGGILRIPPGKRRLEFHYTGLSLGAPENVRFRYQLEGLDDHWIEAGRERSAFYSLLPAGRYRFRVTGCANSGLWNQEGAALAFEVEPFFWQTWWFRAGVAAGLILGVGALVRYASFRRLRLRLRRLEQEAAVQKDRARIAKDLHDDLGAQLSQVAMLSELAQTDFDKPAQSREHIDQIFRTARSATRSLDEIVWEVNPRNDSLDRFAAHICTYAPEFLRAASINCRLDVPMELPAMPLAANVRHHVYLAFKEALHNVVKHAGATEVWLRLSLAAGELTLVIEDNGRGFQAGSSAEPGEDGLANLSHRMSEIGGRFEQRSEPGRGTRTTLVAPLPNAEGV